MTCYYFIRHGRTEGNTKKRYIGITDEPLLEASKKELRHKIYPKVQGVFVSPMKRCIETAKIIYGDKTPFYIIEEIKECDFGDFENKNYLELGNNLKYQEWINSNGVLPFPNGEGQEEFRERCILGFHKIEEICIEKKFNVVAIVCHGGSIMSVFEALKEPKKNFYQWWTEHGSYRILER